MQSRSLINNNRRNRKKAKPYEIAVVLIFVVLACFLSFILIAGFSTPNEKELAKTYALQTQVAMSGNSATATPVQPIGDAASTLETTPNPEDVGTWLTPTPMEMLLEKPEGQVNILLLGSDIRPNDGGFHTDVTLWVSLNPKDGYVSAVSFPRDLYVYIPGYGNERINFAFPLGGFEKLADTFEYNFGIRPDYYAMVDFNGFVAVINNLGGINVQTEKNLTDKCDVSLNPSGICSVGPGLVHMNGDLALWYARSRYSTNDIDRSRRAQEVIEAIFDRLMSLDAVLKIPDLYSAYTTYVETDIPLTEIISFIPLASQIYDNGDIRNYVIGYDQVYDWITYTGAQVLMPDFDAIQEVMIEALSLK
jgi:LCP family protein required for cell wall assembly